MRLEIVVENQIRNLLFQAILRHSHSRRLRCRHRKGRSIHMLQHILLLDNIDRVAHFADPVTNIEQFSFQAQNLLPVFLAFGSRRSEQFTSLGNHVHHRILPLMQLFFLQQQRHIFRISLQPGYACRYLPPTAYREQGYNQGQQNSFTLRHIPGHFHHLIKNSCINPNSSRRPSNISTVQINFTPAGSIW